MSSVEGSHSHAKTSATLAKERALQVSAAVCGLSTRESFASYDRELSSWKTLQRCVLAGSELYSGTWPHSGMIRSGRAYELPTLEHRIVGSGCSSWPTPTSRDWKDGDCRNANVEANGLLGRVALEHQPKGSLNPDWVEALQGFPPGWTDGLPDEAKPSTRGNRRASRRKRTKDGSG